MGKKKKELYKILKVTFEVDYLIKMHNDEISLINGWTIDELIEDWFKNYSLSSYHASREGHAIGNSKKFIKANVSESKEAEWKVKVS